MRNLNPGWINLSKILVHSGIHEIIKNEGHSKTGDRIKEAGVEIGAIESKFSQDKNQMSCCLERLIIILKKLIISIK